MRDEKFYLHKVAIKYSPGKNENYSQDANPIRKNKKVSTAVQAVNFHVCKNCDFIYIHCTCIYKFIYLLPRHGVDD